MINPIPFIASTADEAVARIRAQLGSEAVVLNVRPLPANGIARFWKKPMIEVLAYRPEEPAPVAPGPAVSETLEDFREQLNQIRHQLQTREQADQKPARAARAARSGAEPGEPWREMPEPPEPASGGWRAGRMLEKNGLLPRHAKRIEDRLRARHGDRPPEALGEELKLARALMGEFWPRLRPWEPKAIHVLAGPAGSGKTTCLCKWLTQAALVEGRKARVWRLDGATANMAESLSVYCDILGVTCERTWPGPGESLTEDIGFIDLPGVDWRNPQALQELAGRLGQLGPSHVHLVLNAAYDTPVLMTQLRAFQALPVENLIISHLDEELNWDKIWNLVLGTNYSISHFSTGQNIPGDFTEASAELVLDRQFPRK